MQMGFVQSADGLSRTKDCDPLEQKKFCQQMDFGLEPQKQIFSGLQPGDLLVLNYHVISSLGLALLVQPADLDMLTSTTA